jgi:hypothetical protein
MIRLFDYIDNMPIDPQLVMFVLFVVVVSLLIELLWRANSIKTFSKSFARGIEFEIGSISFRAGIYNKARKPRIRKPETDVHGRQIDFLWLSFAYIRTDERFID